MKDLNFKVDEDFYWWFKQAALDRRTSLVGLLRACAETYVAEQEVTASKEKLMPHKKKKKSKHK